MGCNAWNHPHDCNCGWGGDTGWALTPKVSIARTLRVTDGYTWRFDRKPTYESYVSPNALCPVCGAHVYFYQSPVGGRVFFDELGPPWPKHPCTDGAFTGSGNEPECDYILAPPTTTSQKTSLLHAPHAWRPLLADDLTNIGEFDRIRMPRQDRLPSVFLYVPAGWIGSAPAFWRWCPTDARFVEISAIRPKGIGDVESQTLSVPIWLRNDEEFEHWCTNHNAQPSPEALNAIGFALSFAWRLSDRPEWHKVIPCIDLVAARSFFERASESGFWAAINNLGVIYRDGLGVAFDQVKAFEFFQRAAQSLESTPLKHLANCYREGLGCPRNLEFAEFLEELIAVRHE